jgi:hypothetical protein
VPAHLKHFCGHHDLHLLLSTVIVERRFLLRECTAISYCKFWNRRDGVISLWLSDTIRELDKIDFSRVAG